MESCLKVEHYLNHNSHCLPRTHHLLASASAATACPGAGRRETGSSARPGGRGTGPAGLAAGPPLALAFSKALLNYGGTRSMEEALDAEGAAQSVNLGSNDAAEAIAAFLERREPKFSGT